LKVGGFSTDDSQIGLTLVEANAEVFSFALNPKRRLGKRKDTL
jgi:hypothetical protein